MDSPKGQQRHLPVDFFKCKSDVPHEPRLQRRRGSSNHSVWFIQHSPGMLDLPRIGTPLSDQIQTGKASRYSTVPAMVVGKTQMHRSLPSQNVDAIGIKTRSNTDDLSRLAGGKK